MVLLQFIQMFFFGFLNGKIFKPSAKVTYDDIYYGIPSVLTCVESFIFSLIFFWSFNSKEYHPDNVRTGGNKMTTWRAILDAMNMSDIVKGIILMFRLAISVGPGTPKIVGKFTGKTKAGRDNDDMQHLEPYSGGRPSRLSSDTEHLEPYSGGRSRRLSNESLGSEDGLRPYHEGGYNSPDTAYRGRKSLEIPQPTASQKQGYGSYSYIAPPRSASPSPNRGSQRG
jgi:hypothetical protein